MNWLEQRSHLFSDLRRLSPTYESHLTTMKAMNLTSLLALFCGWLAVFSASPSVAKAASQAVTGAVAGRVFNTASGQYLEKARLTIVGTNRETFTDSEGNFRFVNLPAGTIKVTAFFTGLMPQTEVVVIAAGQTVQHDITFTPSSKTSEVVRLSKFLVEASREMTGAALAINEQRFAPNIKTVVSTDEFGMVAEGNAGEFLKFMPGVSVDSSGPGGNSRLVSINGVPPNNVPVTIGGFDLASGGAPNQTSRAVEIDMVSINNISRIEVSFSPTPETSGSALAGSINMVPRSAFERARPVLNGTAYVMMRDNARSWHKTPGPFRPTRKVHPGFEFSYLVPVNKRFGFTLSAGMSTQYTPADDSRLTWRANGSPTNGTTFPNTTPDKPYLSAYNVIDRDTDSDRESFAATMDYKISNHDRISLSFQYAHNVFTSMSRSLTFDVGGVSPGNFTTTSTRGNVAAGSIVQANGGESRNNWTYMPTLAWRHEGPLWRIEAGVGYSRGRMNDSYEGYIESSSSGRSGLTISFDDIFYLRPRSITVADGVTGLPVDPYSINSYQLRAANDFPRRAINIRSSAHANVGREFIWRVPLTLKAGLNFSRELRDNPGSGSIRRTFIGPDGRPAIAVSGLPAPTTFALSDDGAARFLDASYSQRLLPFGFPKLQAVDNRKMLEYYTSNPAHFFIDENTGYRDDINTSKRSEETISAAYVRGDLAFFQSRLKLTGGVRAEQTNVEAEGPLTDPTKNVQRSANGRPSLGANGIPLPITTNAFEVSKLTFIRRGLLAEKEYLRLFPSLNASFGLRENLIARASLYRSIGRPDFNQYSGGITLPNLDTSPSATNVITVNNVGIKAWSAQTTSVRLEYYFEGVGQISIGGFRRDFENFFGSAQFDPTPEFLAFYGLDPDIYGQFPVSTQQNVEGTVRMTGLDFSYSQALTFLPDWARGVKVFANAAAQRTTGPESANFSGFVPRTFSWGISLNRPKYNVRMNWNYRGRTRRALVRGAGIEPGTYNWGSKQLQLDVMGEYSFYKAYTVFANLRNVGDEPVDTEIAGLSTPPHAQFSRRLQLGSLWTFGVKAVW